ncbi:MAG: DUF2254 family protein [Pricia sp.]
MLSNIKNLLKSIALVPSVLALSFFVLAIFLVSVNISYETYSPFKALIITNSGDIQFILAYVIGGIFTLTIFSYTMVMNVINRNINNYSPRLIPLILSQRHHQIILGFTSGTIIYSIVLSISLINRNSDYFPSIGAALAAIFSIVCVFIFIYFIHSVSKSVHINYILMELYRRTHDQMHKRDKSYGVKDPLPAIASFEFEIRCENTGVLRLYSIGRLKKLSNSLGCKIQVNKVCGEHVFIDDILLRTDKRINESQISKLKGLFAIGHEVAVDVHEIGFKHFVEVAVKASSPAINDPGTSKSCIDYLTQLFISRLSLHFDSNIISICNSNINVCQITTRKLLIECFVEMYRYMKDDPLLKPTLKKSLRTITSKTTQEIDFDWNKLKRYDGLL